MKVQQYVRIDPHRRRSAILRVDEHGEHTAPVRIDNDAATLAAEVTKGGEHPEVVFEATYGWYRPVDVFAGGRGDGAPSAPVGVGLRS